MAKKNNDVSPTLPPYLPFKTFQSFIKGLHETVVPRRIDSTLLRSYSGSVQSQLRGTLRFFGLIDEADQTMDKLRELVAVYDTPEWQTALEKAVSEAYKNLIDGIELHSATRGEVEGRFRAQGADGDVLRKCLAFYVAAATAGGISLSPHIIAERRGRPVQARARSKKTKQEAKTNELDRTEDESQAGRIKVNLPLPSNPSNTITVVVSEDVTVEDWAMVDATMRTFIEKRSKLKE